MGQREGAGEVIEADRCKVTAENVKIDACGLFAAVEVSIPNISFAWSLNKPSKKAGSLLYICIYLAVY